MLSFLFPPPLSPKQIGWRNRNKGKSDAPSLPRTLQLDANCTNIYGMLEINADGRGGALPLSLGKN